MILGCGAALFLVVGVDIGAEIIYSAYFDLESIAAQAGSVSVRRRSFQKGRRAVQWMRAKTNLRHFCFC